MLGNNHLMIEEKPGSSDETPDPQVKRKTIRRAFTTAYKLSILEQADQCQGHGEVGALLRREGLYSSHLSSWRRLRPEATLQALKNKKHGPKATLDPAERRELEQLRRRNSKLEHELEKAGTIIDVQKELFIVRLPQLLHLPRECLLWGLPRAVAVPHRGTVHRSTTVGRFDFPSGSSRPIRHHRTTTDLDKSPEQSRTTAVTGQYLVLRLFL